MGDTSDNNFTRLYSVLDKVTSSLSEISKEREELNSSLSNLAQKVESKNSITIEKFNKLEKLLRSTEININTDINKIRIENRTVDSGFTDRINKLELQIKQMEESLKILQVKHDENLVLIDKLTPKIGKKRKWWQVI
jgi:hypothetical protein